MNKYLKYGIIIAIVIVAVSFLVSLQFEKSQDNSLSLPKIKSQAANFTLKNYKGESVSLLDFRGKIIYIKFWASWCKDCVKQVVPQRNLEASMTSNPSVAFLNISVDDSEDAWKKAVERNKLSAEQLISLDGDEENINTNYDISEIPRYIIIGKSGEVLNNNAPHPGEIKAEYFAQFN